MRRRREENLQAHPPNPRYSQRDATMGRPVLFQEQDLRWMVWMMSQLQVRAQSCLRILPHNHLACKVLAFLLFFKPPLLLKSNPLRQPLYLPSTCRHSPSNKRRNKCSHNQDLHAGFSVRNLHVRLYRPTLHLSARLWLLKQQSLRDNRH
jgi:hypothetical protein